MITPMASREAAAVGTPLLRSGRPPRTWDIFAVAAIVLITLVVFYPVTRNGFLVLAFDDALILDTPAIRGFSWPNLLACATEFNHAHYMPLTMLSFATDYYFWGGEPWGYHLTNILWHATAAVLFYVFLCPLVPSARVAALAAAIFAVHPLQMEAVSLAVQRKTVLAGALWFLTLILYQRWRRTSARGWYGLCLLAFMGAALAKPAVVPLPLLLLLYDYVFTGRLSLRPAVPFFIIASFISWMTMRAHAAVGAVHALHGGNLLAHLLMVSRVVVEDIDAVVLPVNLSPIYYYSREVIYHPVNFLALALIPALCVYVTVYRRRFPWSFFCLWWFVLALLPESNLLPLAQLRADRFLYLALPALALWVSLGWERLVQAAVGTRWRLLGYLAGLGVVGMLGFACSQSAPVWHDDVSAWIRVVERHPWSAVAHQMLGRAYYGGGDSVNAERELLVALRLSDHDPDTYLYLAKVYAGRGATALARTHLRRFLELVPGDPEGLELLTTITSGDGA